MSEYGIMKTTKILPIGTWGFITGNRLINEKDWKENFPQNIFGRIVEHEVNRSILHKGTYYMVRVYVGQSRKRNEKWHNQRIHPKWFKEII